jgi:uncharacterized protein
VRDRGDHAVLEVDAARVAEVVAAPAVLRAVLDVGFALAEVDPRGFRSGSMNELLADPARFR